MTSETQPITGYRTLTKEEIAVINRFKEWERSMMDDLNGFQLAFNPDPRMLALAKTNFEQGFMWLVKSVAKPE